MLEMEEIFFSGTFGGELLSLAAAKNVLMRHMKFGLTDELESKGKSLISNVEKVISEKKFSSNLQFSGHPTWAFLNWTPTDQYSVEEMKTYFAQLMYESGVLILNSHNITLAHNRRINPKSHLHIEMLSRKCVKALKKVTCERCSKRAL